MSTHLIHLAHLPPMRRTALALLLNAVLAMGALAQDASVAKIRVSAEDAELVADGTSPLRFAVQVQDASGKPLPYGHITVQADAGARLAQSTPSTHRSNVLQLEVQEGQASFELLAPPTPGEVHLQVAAGQVVAQTVLRYTPELREMLAIGVVEGIISKNHLQAGSITPTGFNDGFEQEIVRWSRELGDETSAGLHTAFYLKGKIRGDVLLTAAYDSDRDTRLKLAQSIDPQATYPVYGDNSVASLDTRSSDRLYVRLDKGRSFLLYGDFATTGALHGNGAAQPVGSAPMPEPLLLGRYNRSATGLRGHHEAGLWQGDGFLTFDTLKQAVEEYPANGTSGPFAVANNNAVQDSERVELLVRDKNQRNLIKRATTLLRYVDYSFEPFSGRILLTQPLATLTPQGDPQSLRISYEVDQGGTPFYTYGLAADLAVASPPAGQPEALELRVGGSAVTDENPLSPYQLASVHAKAQLGERLALVVEAAQTQATQHAANGSLYPISTSLSGEVDSTELGQAQRAELAWHQPALDARVWWMRTDAHFSNPSAGLGASRVEAGTHLRSPLSDTLAAYASYQQSEDTLNNLGRYDSAVGLSQQLSPELNLDWSLRSLRDNSGFAPEAQLAGNSPQLGTAGSSNGGFFGTGTSNTVIDPLTGAPISTLAATGSTATAHSGNALEATTARAGFAWQKTPDWLVQGSVEASVHGEGHNRAELGSVYSLTPTDRLYAQLESQTGLAAPGALNDADRSTSVSAGLSHAANANTTVFSEYRLVDAQSDNNPASFDQMLVNGLQHRRQLSEGLQAQMGAEYLSVLSGNQRQALALTGGLDWVPDSRTRAGTKLEYRRLSDASTSPGDQTQDQWLSTLSFARKLDVDWTLLVKNYYLLQQNHDDASGNRMGDSQQERLITGFAWRPTAHNRMNALARYEYKSVDDRSQLLGDRYTAHIGSVLMDYHPSRAWWTSTRLAAKSSSDYTVTGADQGFNAWLAGVRLTWDIGDAVDFGFLASTLRQSGDSAAQDAYGVEAGYQVHKNVWVALGYNWSGYYDRDLAGVDYTRQGVYLRLRAKFDETSLPR